MNVILFLRAFLDSLVVPCCILLAFMAAGCFFRAFWGLLLCRVGGRGVQTAVFIALGVVATLVGGGKGVHRVPAPPQLTPWHSQNSDGGENLPVARAFGIVRIVLSNDTCWIESAWTNGCFQAGTLLDHLVKTNLEDAVWAWHGTEIVGEKRANALHGIDLDAFTLPRPHCLFVCVVPRLPVSDLRDSDGDGLPDNYELHGGTNPWVKDADLVARTRLTSVVGLQEMLDKSAPYDIFELAPGEYELPHGVTLPLHPVMLCAAEPYAVIRSQATPAVFMLVDGQTGQTMFRNLSVRLDARSGFQAAFWCGGNLPWSGTSASASFRNVYVRMPQPGTECFGWHLYRWNGVGVDLAGCTVNAAGATWAIGVYGYDPPPLRFRGCSFLNFPTNRLSASSCGVYLETSFQNFGGATNTVAVSLSDTLFDASFTNSLPLARIERGTNFLVSADRCIVPTVFAEGHGPDILGSLWTTNAGVAWCGVPFPGSSADTFGVGAHVVLVPGDQDTDGDGDNDYVEAYQYGTDPWMVDSDGDGVEDARERTEGTDPRDGTSFLRTLAVTVTNETTETGTSTHVYWGTSPAIEGDKNGETSFTGCTFTTNYTGLTVSGPLYVKAFRDLDGDGVCSPVREPFIVRDAGYGHAISRFTLAFGDVDGDLVSDVDEWRQGTDPNDADDFRLVFTLSVTNVDHVVGITNFLFFGASPMDGTANAFFSGEKLDVSVSAVVSNGHLPVICWRDLDRDGRYTPGVDTVFSNAYGCSVCGRKQTFRIGDFDGDGIGDGVEISENTDVFEKDSHCYNLWVTYTDVFQTTNALTFEARFGTNTVWGSAVVADGTWVHNFGHCTTTNGERASVSVWDDVNRNGRWDEGECSNCYDVTAITSHNMHVTEPLAYLNFDRDRDNLPDWWEMANGLDIDGNPKDEYADPDGDGLINLHEFWAGSNPLVPDGSNTLLSVLTRSIDGRIESCDVSTSIYRFSNYQENGILRQFIPNTNFWARTVDFSCVSMWNDATNDIWGGVCNGWNMGGTAISRRHVLCAHHYGIPTGTTLYFMSKDSRVVERRIVAQRYVGNNVTGGDMRVCLLDSDLPLDVVPAKILPPSYPRYIRTARFLPMATFDQEEKLVVCESSILRCVEERKLDSVGMKPSIGRRVDFYESMIAGDSGNPRFLLVEDCPIFVCMMWHGGAGGGCLITHYKSEIQSAMDSLCPGYELSEVCLDEYEELP